MGRKLLLIFEFIRSLVIVVILLLIVFTLLQISLFNFFYNRGNDQTIFIIHFISAFLITFTIWNRKMIWKMVRKIRNKF